MQRVTIAGVIGWIVLVLAASPLVAVEAQGAPAGAQPAAQGAAAPQDQFVPVKSLPQQEQLPASMLVTTAYAFVWVVLLVYVWTIWRRLGKVEREMHDLSARIGEKR